MLTFFDQDMAMVNNVNFDPFESNSQPIKQLGPEGWFSLQLQAPMFVGKQTLEEYQCDHHQNDQLASTGKGGMHHKLVYDPPVLFSSSQDMFSVAMYQL